MMSRIFHAHYRTTYGGEVNDVRHHERYEFVDILEAAPRNINDPLIVLSPLSLSTRNG